MSLESHGERIIMDLRDDVFSVISQSLLPEDICNLGICCRRLNNLMGSDKVWLPQCELVGIVTLRDLVKWRKQVVSYKALCRFLISVKPLMGIWVHQNPEVGNLVYVMPGFVSVVGCRVIPQTVGPLGIDDGPILWAPVFEIVSDEDGLFAFFLHGREGDIDYVYPGEIKSIEKTCNVLLLEVDPRELMNNDEKRENFAAFVDDVEMPNNNKEDLVQRKSFRCFDACFGRRVSRSDDYGVSTSKWLIENDLSPASVFSKLSFDDRRKLLKIVTRAVRVVVPDSPSSTLFPCLREDEVEIMQLSKRRALLIKMKRLERERTNCTYNSEKCGRLHEFLSPGNRIGLTLHASIMLLSSYEAWPCMDKEMFALYKLPMVSPVAGQEYAGLWGGTYGWPPRNSTKDEPRKALFFIVISYHDQLPRKRVMIATKILEGTGYALYPNGSAMFIVNINKPSAEPFPFNNCTDSDSDSPPVDVKCGFTGEGIADGYGFRYPGSKPGSLFVLQDGMLAFIWKESGEVVTLERLYLQDLLKKGEKVPPLPPIANFSYLNRSYGNVFTKFPNTNTSSSSSRYVSTIPTNSSILVYF